MSVVKLSSYRQAAVSADFSSVYPSGQSCAVRALLPDRYRGGLCVWMRLSVRAVFIIRCIYCSLSQLDVYFRSKAAFQSATMDLPVSTRETGKKEKMDQDINIWF